MEKPPSSCRSLGNSRTGRGLLIDAGSEVFATNVLWETIVMDDAKLQLLRDRAEISDVQLRYATGLDSRDWPLFRSCFTDEVETDFTSVFGGEARKVSADRWTEAARRSLSGLKATQHMITNHVITVAGDNATCVAYVQARHVGRFVLVNTRNYWQAKNG